MSDFNRIPVEMLIAVPTFSGTQISPNGTRIAYLAPWRDRLTSSCTTSVVGTLRERGHDVEFLLNQKEGHWLPSPWVRQTGQIDIKFRRRVVHARHAHV